MRSFRNTLCVMAAAACGLAVFSLPARAETRDVVVVSNPCAKDYGAGVLFTTVTCVGNVEAKIAGADAVSAICSPSNTTVCSSPRTVTIELSNFLPSSTVHVWFVKGDQDFMTYSACEHLSDNVDDDVTDLLLPSSHLGDAAVNTAGSGSLVGVSLPPAGGWLYGSNWICATTAPHAGGSGHHGAQLFTVYPA